MNSLVHQVLFFLLLLCDACLYAKQTSYPDIGAARRIDYSLRYWDEMVRKPNQPLSPQFAQHYHDRGDASRIRGKAPRIRSKRGKEAVLGATAVLFAQRRIRLRKQDLVL